MITRHDIKVPFEQITYNAHAVAVQGEEGFVKNAIAQRMFPGPGTEETKTAKAKKLYELCVAACKEANMEFEVLPLKLTTAEREELAKKEADRMVKLAAKATPAK